MDDEDDSKIFPQRLMEILGEESNQEAICWLPHGRAFIVRNRKLFAELVMPKYFSRKAKYSSFARKLNRWNFVRVSSGPELGAYYHEFFLRDKPQLAAQMFCKNARTKLAMAGETTVPPVAATCPSVEAATAAMAKASVSGQPSIAADRPSTSGNAANPMHHPPQLQLSTPQQQQKQQLGVGPSYHPCVHPQHRSSPQPNCMPQLPSDVPLQLLQQILSKEVPAPPSMSGPGSMPKQQVENQSGPVPSILLQQAQYANMLVERQIAILHREQAKRMVYQQAMQHNNNSEMMMFNPVSGMPMDNSSTAALMAGQPPQMAPQRLLQMQQLMYMQRQRKANRPTNHRASAA